MVNFKLTLIVVLLSSLQIYAQESKHQASVQLIAGFDKFSYQIIDMGSYRDEFLDDNSLGAGLGYSYELMPSFLLTGGLEYQWIKGKVKGMDGHEYLKTSSAFLSLGIQTDINELPLYFDLAYLYIIMNFKEGLDDESFFKKQSTGHGFKIGLSYSHPLSKSSNLKMGIYSYGILVGGVGFHFPDDRTDDSRRSLGVLTSLQVGYSYKF